MSDCHAFFTHIITQHRKVLRPAWHLTTGKLIPVKERSPGVYGGRRLCQCVHSAIIWSRNLDCVLAERQQLCRDCAGPHGDYLHELPACYSGKAGLMTDEHTENAYRKRPLTESTFTSFCSRLSSDHSTGLKCTYFGFSCHH